MIVKVMIAEGRGGEEVKDFRLTNCFKSDTIVMFFVFHFNLFLLSDIRI